MIKVDDKTVEIRGKLLDIIDDLTNVMSSVRKTALFKSDERQIDELFLIAIELSKKKPEEITPEYRKLVREVVKARLSPQTSPEEAPVDWTKVPVDTPILVREHVKCKWEKRHFARYEDNEVYAWSKGKTSFTVDDRNECCYWKFAKLAEDGDEA